MRYQYENRRLRYGQDGKKFAFCFMDATAFKIFKDHRSSKYSLFNINVNKGGWEVEN